MTYSSSSFEVFAMTATAKQSLKRSSSAPEKPSFWSMAHELSKYTEYERLERIRAGFEPYWLLATKAAFGLTIPMIAGIANVSVSTVERRLRSTDALDAVASERIDRLAQVAVLAEDVFEKSDAASKWMATPNDSLGGRTPLSLCETELGARQVRRVLHAIEWGGVV
ncbi:type II RES/Xre toxin-antitoxin system antitoxin [Stutzerimonas stutzeri]|jgi:putative toxin-antitoxin system antitoxin component (TIGR02293 family)|uniref:type II RES/Xre toxin-antitoxin system antitoxin n=2 Tax=Stutzerimonas stutzeri TaxID=316 RepID=UPI001E4BEC57|nr:MbcA/ParS/Xre antitoxin family protein [Stutzerimonas stutzeri]WRQ01361.1 MbcA/ParS/Xre antitoxin family protein [Stutzerimonas stutzeri]